MSEIFDSCIKGHSSRKRVQERDTMCEEGAASGLRLPDGDFYSAPFRLRFFCERTYEQSSNVTVGVTSHDDEEFKTCPTWLLSMGCE